MTTSRTGQYLLLLVLMFVTTQAQGPSTSLPGQVALPKPATPAGGAAKNADPNKGTGIIRGHIMLANGRPARRASIQLVSRGTRATAVGSASARWRFPASSTPR